jgi:biopolymer transport protein ExbD
MARKSRRQKQQEEVSKEVEIDMTPMIDVVFLLIIFFLCIDFKVLEAKLPAYLPKDKGSQPDIVEPQEQLRIKIVCDTVGTKELRPNSKTAYYLDGHKVHYTVGSKKVETLVELKEELEAIYKDPQRDVPDPKNPGKTRKLGVVVEPGTNVVYGDVAPCVDAINATGFDDINFGGGLGSSKTGAYKDQPRKKTKK